MKGLIFISASVLLVSYAVSLVAANQPTPVAISNGTHLTTHPLLQQINHEMNQQWKKIQLDEKSGKLTPDQSKALRKKRLDTIKQIAAVLESNANNQDLTADQAAQIFKQLKINAQSIP
jgi:hypothetical protein